MGTKSIYYVKLTDGKKSFVIAEHISQVETKMNQLEKKIKSITLFAEPKDILEL